MECLATSIMRRWPRLGQAWARPMIYDHASTNVNLSIVLGLFSTLRQWRQRDRWTRQQLDAHQANALRAVREYAFTHSPFYQRFHRGLADRPLHELPVLTKSMLMEHFDELVTDRSVRREDVAAHVSDLSGDERFLGRYWVCATSGSTGQPGLFVFDRSEWTAIMASFARAHEWAGIAVGLTHRMRMASVASTAPWHMSARVGLSLRSRWMPALRLDAGEPLEAIIDKLNAWQPEMLVAYASMARLLADEQAAGHLHIAPHLVFTSSEVLTDDTRRRVETVWGQRLFNQYAATESGGLAAECTEHQGMHLFEDLVLCEVVDGENRPVAPGAWGDKLLITALFSRTQPLIRYEISDSVRLATEECPCGRPHALLDGIQGRVEDVVYLRGVAGGEVAIRPGLFHRILDTVPAGGWQVVQEQDELRILLSSVRDGFMDAELIELLRQALAVQGAVVPPITVQRVPAIPRGPSGKTPSIKTLARAAARTG